jgi:sulfonate transport system substrate-binding protein
MAVWLHGVFGRCSWALSLIVALGCSRSGSVESADTEGARTSTEAFTLRIGCQKSSLLLNLLRAGDRLQKRLGPDVTVVFKEFPAGPQLLEALNVGGIDFGHAGETPPVFAQAAGVPLVYAACEEESPRSEAIIVQADSPIRQVAELRGKRIALNKGSNVHYLLVRALEAAGLSYDDVQPVFLPPADARAAFESRSVDAWVVWDPFYAAVERAGSCRLLVDGTGLVGNRGYYLASRALATDHAAVLQSLVEELAVTSKWVEENQDASVKFLAETLSMDVATIDLAERRRRYGVMAVDPTIAGNQQEVADCLARIGLIPRSVQVADVVWTPLHSWEGSSHGNVLVPADTR